MDNLSAAQIAAAKQTTIILCTQIHYLSKVTFTNTTFDRVQLLNSDQKSRPQCGHYSEVSLYLPMEYCLRNNSPNVMCWTSTETTRILGLQSTNKRTFSNF